MNARTSKLIRRFCTSKNLNYRHSKAAWNKLPRTERHDARLSLTPAMWDSIKTLSPYRRWLGMISGR